MNQLRYYNQNRHRLGNSQLSHLAIHCHLRKSWWYRCLWDIDNILLQLRSISRIQGSVLGRCLDRQSCHRSHRSCSWLPTRDRNLGNPILLGNSTSPQILVFYRFYHLFHSNQVGHTSSWRNIQFHLHIELLLVSHQRKICSHHRHWASRSSHRFNRIRDRHNQILPFRHLNSRLY